MKKLNLKSIAFLTFIMFSTTFTFAQKPNIVVILADDLGLGSISPYGAPASALTTPALNDLAAEGRKFTNAYTPTSMCSPSRYALMSGRYYFRDVRDWGIIQNSDDCTLVEGRFNLASRLKNAGYNTGGIGKWHMGYTGSSNVPFPIADYVGFDYWHDYRVRPDGTEIDEGRDNGGDNGDGDLDRTRTAEYSDNKVTEWINSQDNDTPFFLYFAPIGIHTPIIPGDAYRRKSAAYNNATNSTARDESLVTDYIEELDGSVQNILDALEDKGFTDNTIIIFTSDNGAVTGHTRELRDAPINFYANGIYDGANTDKLNGSKLRIHDAGFRVPMIIKWPNGGIPKGSSSDELVNIIDIYSTLMEALNIEMLTPEEEAGDSYSFYPALFGDVDEPIRDNMIVNSYEGIRAIYVDNYKYIDGIPREPADKNGDRQYMNFGSRRYEAEAHEQLYRLSTDPFEKDDRINNASESTRVSNMKKLLEDVVDKGYSRPDYGSEPTEPTGEFSLKILSPAEDQIFTTSENIQVNLEINGGPNGLDRVNVFYRATSPVVGVWVRATDGSGETWNIGNLTASNYQIRVVAFDNEDNRLRENIDNIKVNNEIDADNELSVSITYPAEGDIISITENIIVEVEASGNESGLSAVNIFLNKDGSGWNFQGRLTPGPDGLLTGDERNLDIGQLSVGNYVLRAIAIDGENVEKIRFNTNFKVENIMGRYFEGKTVKLNSTSAYGLETDFQIYPNPANTEDSIITIDNIDAYNNISLIDISGKIIFSEIISENFYNIPILNREAGIYFIKLTNQNVSVTKKIILK